MTGHEAHLVVNHLPIVGAFLGLALVLLAVVRREVGVVYSATLVLALAALGGGAAYLTGEEAEEAVEDRAGLDHDDVEEHEEGAIWALGGLLLAAGTGGWLSWQVLRGRPLTPAGGVVWVVTALLAASTTARMGFTGRTVGHAELYGDSGP